MSPEDVGKIATKVYDTTNKHQDTTKFVRVYRTEMWKEILKFQSGSPERNQLLAARAACIGIAPDYADFVAGDYSDTDRP